MTVLKPMLKLALFPLLLLLILAQWVGIFLTTFSTVLTNLLAGLFFFVALASWIMKLADGGEVLKMLITAFVVFVLPYVNDGRLFAINAETGKLCESFANKGILNLQTNMPVTTPGMYEPTSPPAIKTSVLRTCFPESTL